MLEGDVSKSQRFELADGLRVSGGSVWLHGQEVGEVLERDFGFAVDVDDVAEFLETPEEMAAYLEACIQESEGDVAFIAKALGDIARAKGMTQIARETGLSRESLYKALSGDRSPSFDTILKVVSALGLQLSASVRDGEIVEDGAEVA